jgi:hypothetical protein
MNPGEKQGTLRQGSFFCNLFIIIAIVSVLFGLGAWWLSWQTQLETRLGVEAKVQLVNLRSTLEKQKLRARPDRGSQGLSAQSSTPIQTISQNTTDNFQPSLLYSRNPQLAADAFRVGLRLRFRYLYDRFGLTTSQARQLENLLGADGPLLDALEAVARSTGASAKLKNGVAADIINRMVSHAAEVINTQDLEQFREAVATSELQKVVNAVAVAASISQDPFPADSAANLRDLLLQGLPSDRIPNQYVTLESINWAKVLPLVQSQLSQAQAQVVDAIAKKISVELYCKKLSGPVVRGPLPGVSIPGF